MGGWGAVRVALDVGTANTLIHVQGRGIAVDEPSLVRVRCSTGDIEAVGAEAEAGAGRTPPKFQTVHPVRAGTIAHLKLCEGMLRRLLGRAGLPVPFRRMQAAIAVPSGTTEVERAALVESLRDADAGDVLLLEQPLAAARGAGLSVDGPRACMIVDIGAGVTEVAVLSLSGIVYARTVAVGGNDMDAAIVEHVRAAHHLLIGERTAERAKIAAGSAAPLDAPLAVQIKGRCLVRGVPRDVVLGHGEIRAALAGPVGRILLAVREVLEQAPPEPCADLVETGIVLTGGSALLRGLDRRISADCGLPVRVAEKPLASVVIGLADLFARMRGRELRRLRCAV